MKRLLAAILIAVLVVATTLASVFMLVATSIKVAEMSSPLLRAAAVAAELVLGVLLLVGTVYLATHAAVLIFGEGSANPRR